MECLLRIGTSVGGNNLTAVLILILMECLLSALNRQFTSISSWVLILILMECLLSGLERTPEKSWLLRLNPYSNGMLT